MVGTARRAVRVGVIHSDAGGAASLPVLADEVEEGFAVLGELLGADAVDFGQRGFGLGGGLRLG